MRTSKEFFTLRVANRKDLPTMSRLKLELDRFHENMPIWPPESDLKEARRSISKHMKQGKCFVAISPENEIVGFTTVRLTKRETVHSGYRRVGEIGFLYVKEDQRRHNVGQHLVSACINFFEKKGIEHVTTRSVVYNKIADRFWNKLSFQPAIYVRSTTVGKVKQKLRELHSM